MKHIEVGAQLIAVAVAGGLLFSNNAHAHALNAGAVSTVLAYDYDDSRREDQLNEERQRRQYDEARAREAYDREQRERQRQDDDRRRQLEQQRYYNN